MMYNVKKEGETEKSKEKVRKSVELCRLLNRNTSPLSHSVVAYNCGKSALSRDWKNEEKRACRS